MRSPVNLRKIKEQSPFRHAGDRHEVELAVLHVRAVGDPHAAAEGRGVRYDGGVEGHGGQGGAVDHEPDRLRAGPQKAEHRGDEIAPRAAEALAGALEPARDGPGQAERRDVYEPPGARATVLRRVVDDARVEALGLPRLQHGK